MRPLTAFLLIGALSSMTWAACSCGTTCTSASCSSGCCDPNGFCLSGTANTACGIRGQSCQSCASGKACVNQSCGNAPDGSVTNPDAGSSTDAGICNAASCATGCCLNGSCLHSQQQSTNSCGTGGQACQPCDVNTQVCQNGACVTGCSSISCGGCCNAGTCVDFSSQSNGNCGYGGENCRPCPAGNSCSNQGLCVLPIDAGVDAGPTYDFPCGNYPPCALSQDCCTTITGSGVTFNCMPKGSCANGDVISCDGPEECSAGVCCGIENVNGGSSPSCTPTTLGAVCAASSLCPTQFANNCMGTNQVVICHTSPDCTDPNNNNCCAFSQNGATLTFCVSSTLTFFADQCF